MTEDWKMSDVRGNALRGRPKHAIHASIGTFLVVMAFAAATSAEEITTSSSGEGQAVQLFRALKKSANWQLVGKTRLKFRTYHPQGMVKIGKFFFLSSVEIIERTKKFDRPEEGYDRTPGKGVGHLFKFGKDGGLISSVTLGEGIVYHPGGIDYDGRWLWVPVAEYRPNSSSIIYRVDPETMQATEIFRFRDHIGGVVHNIENNTLHGVSWGSRRFYTWDLDETLDLRDPSIPADKLRRVNGNYYVDYQDCQYLRHSYMLCGGVIPSLIDQNP